MHETASFLPVRADAQQPAELIRVLERTAADRGPGQYPKEGQGIGGEQNGAGGQAAQQWFHSSIPPPPV